MRPLLIITFVSALQSAGGQTQVDLKTQTKSTVDFSQATLTKPIQAGTALPLTCTIAQMFFKTNAVAAQNLFACTASDTWTLIGGIPNPSALFPSMTGNAGKLLTTDGVNAAWSSVPPGSVTIQNGVSVVGTRPAMEFIAGTGLVTTIADTGSEIRVQHTVDTGVVATVQGQQSGAAVLCASASGSGTSYTCSLSPSLGSYEPGMRLHWIPDVGGTGGVTTLEVDLLGAKRLRMSGGLADPTTADIQAGSMYDVWYDGTEFRFVSDGLVTESVTAARPTCEVSISGRIWYTQGGTGVKDGLSVCAKDETDAYGWRILY